MIIGVDLIPQSWRKRLSERASVARIDGWPLGLLLASVPCHSLGFVYGLAVMTGTVWGGALVLFGHAVATMPGLLLGVHLFRSMSHRGRRIRALTRGIVLVLVLFNLAYFGSRLFYSHDESLANVLFCL
jgi:sulfite exporter TauE/SafE